MSGVDDNGAMLTTIGWEAASDEELKAIVDTIKLDLDVILKKSRQRFSRRRSPRSKQPTAGARAALLPARPSAKAAALVFGLSFAGRGA
jgi:hypothetical protein